MKDKIIDLIKKFRAESEKHWSPETGYKDGYARGWSVAKGYDADALEKLLKEDEEK